MNTTDFSIKVLGKTMPLTVLEALGLLEAGIIKRIRFSPVLAGTAWRVSGLRDD